MGKKKKRSKSKKSDSVLAQAQKPSGMTYDYFKDCRQRFEEGARRGHQKVDEIVLTGAAGTLVLSITFIKDIASQPVGETRWLVLIGWGLLLLTLALSFWSHGTSRDAHEAERTRLDTAYQEGQMWVPATNPKNQLTMVLNRLATICFVAGVCCLAAFAFANFSGGPSDGNPRPAGAVTSTPTEGADSQGRDSLPTAATP